MVFLDSTVLIDFLRGDQQAIQILKVEEQKDQFFTSEINVFELVDGVYSSGKNVQQHLEKIFVLLSLMTVLPFDRKAALKAGMISGTLNKEGKKIGEIDCLIAGIALANGITEVISANEEHFGRIKELKVRTY